MFGIGFTELLLISIAAVLFLGPDKLPETMVQIAKFMKSIKNTISDAKNTLNEEMQVADLKEEALSYKNKLDSATNELKGFKNIDIDNIMDSGLEDDKPKKSSPYASEAKSIVEVEQKNETVTLAKKSSTKDVKDEESNSKEGNA